MVTFICNNEKLLSLLKTGHSYQLKIMSFSISACHSYSPKVYVLTHLTRALTILYDHEDF